MLSINFKPNKLLGENGIIHIDMFLLLSCHLLQIEFGGWACFCGFGSEFSWKKPTIAGDPPQVAILDGTWPFCCKLPRAFCSN